MTAVSVVLCSYNGGRTIGDALDAIVTQTLSEPFEVIVVDDGSTDDTAAIARSFGVRVIVHDINRGLAAARNTGVLAASGAIVAFTDDDCRPTPSWLADLMELYQQPDVVAAGGAVRPTEVTSLVQRYLAANNPLAPLEADLEVSSALPFRLWLYFRKNLMSPTHREERDVYALPGANLSARREALIDAGLFDARMHFAGEDEDACRRLARAFPDSRIIYTPGAIVEHNFDRGLRDTLRRSRAYGEGGGRTFALGGSDHPTIYPWPAVVGLLSAAGMSVAGTLRRQLLSLAVAAPLFAFPRWVVEGHRRRRPDYLLYPWIQLLQEAASNVGFLSGWARTRRRAG